MTHHHHPHQVKTMKSEEIRNMLTISVNNL